MEDEFKAEIKNKKKSDDVKLHSFSKPKTEHKVSHIRHSTHHSNDNNNEDIITKPIIGLIVLAAFVILFNQYQINSVYGDLSSGMSFGHSGSASLSGSKDLESIDFSQITSTAQSLAAVYDLEGLDGDEVMEIMFPTGTPDYGEALGVTFDDPITSLEVLAKMHRGLQAEVKQSNPEAYDRYVELTSSPYGISCEYCCGIGPTGADKSGNSRCGCQHNPAVLSLTLYLTAYTDYTDGEILRENMKWKTLFFPRNMIELGSSIAGGDASVLENLPGMVGGC